MAAIPYCDVSFVKDVNRGIDFSGILNIYLENYIEIASRAIDNFTNQIFYPETITNEKKEIKIDRYGNLVLRTKYKPIASVESLKLKSSPAEELELNIQNLEIFNEQGIVKLYNVEYSSETGYRSVITENYYTTIISYTVANSTIPSPIKLATALLVRNLLRPGDLVMNVNENNSQITQGQLISVKSKSYEERYASTSGGGEGGINRSLEKETDLIFTTDVKVLLAPYIKRGIL